MCRSFLALALIVLLAGCNLDAGTPVPTPDVPRVFITEPENNRQVLQGTNVTIQIEAEDDSVGIYRVELLANDELVQEYEPPNYQVEPIYAIRMSWLAESLGRHVLTAVSYRPDGTESRPATLILEVIPRGTPGAELTPEATSEATPDEG